MQRNAPTLARTQGSYMKATIFHTCAPKSKAAAYEAEEIRIDVVLPFVPVVGTMLKVTPNGDLLRIADVHLDITVAEPLLSIFIEEPDDANALWTWASMKKEGWSLA